MRARLRPVFVVVACSMAVGAIVAPRIAVAAAVLGAALRFAGLRRVAVAAMLALLLAGGFVYHTNNGGPSTARHR